MRYQHLGDIEQRELLPGLRVRFVHAEAMTLAYWDISAGADLPSHDHPHEQVVTVLQGRFELTVGEETRALGPGDVVIIPPGVPHGGNALSPARIIDVFHPVREDYR
jgi:quercetin dioxygenase-like cupin family protein